MASALQSAQAAVWALFDAGWKAVEPTVPVAYPNTQFTPPDPPAPWLYADLTWGSGFPLSIGTNGRNQIVGILGVRINAPKDQGSARLMDLGDKVRNILNRKLVGEVQFGVPTGPRRTGEVNGWADALVTVPVDVGETGA